MLSRHAVKRRHRRWPAPTAVACGAAVTGGLSVFPGSVAAALAGCCAAGVVLCLAWVLRLREQAAAADNTAAQERRLAAARGEAVTHMAAVRLPDVIAQLRTGRAADGPPGPSSADTGPDFARALNSVLHALESDETLGRERALLDSMQAAVESVLRDMHAMAAVQQHVLDGIGERDDDPRLNAAAFATDVAVARMLRRARTLLVVCGSWPDPQQARPVPLADCVFGAQSQIREFGRVEVHGSPAPLVMPGAAGGLTHVLAELLENATVFSPPRSEVTVRVADVRAGVVVEIDDAGPGMAPDVQEQAAARLRGDPDLARLGAVPRLGLICVGLWARKLGLGVELVDGPLYGGTRAIVFVPHRLLTVRAEPAPAARTESTPAREPS